eukprot:3463001-Amphidinium_carterae.3
MWLTIPQVSCAWPPGRMQASLTACNKHAALMIPPMHLWEEESWQPRSLFHDAVRQHAEAKSVDSE